VLLLDHGKRKREKREYEIIAARPVTSRWRRGGAIHGKQGGGVIKKYLFSYKWKAFKRLVD